MSCTNGYHAITIGCNQKRGLLMTAHIDGKAGDFAETMIIPEDPLRAKYITENFLDDAVEVTNIRNMLG